MYEIFLSGLGTPQSAWMLTRQSGHLCVDWHSSEGRTQRSLAAQPFEIDKGVGEGDVVAEAGVGEGHVVVEAEVGEGHVVVERGVGEGHVVLEREVGEGHVVVEAEVG